ncbi:M2 family metallopeptidase [Parahaliea mediterranea]|uniref:M2 family metallopeptidase n=1 Tax=Parahaliea mediterranea TaxID=651086 RepID=A0A939DER1_9GAMM|nr:M2 family metallopeptidase [Parahaliea mediterranea]MBN7796789.1 M2 family metallopeptidase [Parahaliea mediterranea]
MSRAWTLRGLIPLALAAATAAAAQQPDEAQVREFIDAAGERAGELSVRNSRAQWVFQNFITHDTQLMSVATRKALTIEGGDNARRAREYMAFPGLSDRTLRDLELIRHEVSVPSPADADSTTELVEIGAELKSLYSTGKYCDDTGECATLRDMELRLANSRDPDELLELWRGWRQVSPPMRDLYARQVTLANRGARELGYRDLGDYWRSRYDMSGDAFAADMERYWQEAKPLYDALQCHVRDRLEAFYGEEVMPGDGTIPAHLLGNMWAQGWSNIEDVVMGGEYRAPYNLTQILAERDMDALDMVEMAEGFFTSLGLEPLPDTFWERSLFTRPQDREVVCHASAWNVDAVDDLRIKMCIQRTGEEVRVVHHELGHNYYQRAYNDQPFYYRGSANPGFHEAVGDAIALSVTPDYLVRIGLLDERPATSDDNTIAQLMKLALDKVAFLPFGYIMDKWRWQVFAGEVGADQYNDAWWRLRREYQGVSSPAPGAAGDFDPGAKFHIPANVSYSRYFLAHLLQFQFHRELCEQAGFDGPLHACSAYGSERAGEALHAMLGAGKSQPWQDTLEDFTGQRDVDPSAMLEYFAPLKAWLDEQNRGRQCGWQGAS